MTPVIALVGRPNVGKSTLFNRLTRSRDALVADFPGLTRDRLYGKALWFEHPLIVIDTGGIDGSRAQSGIESKMAEQTLKAIDESDVVLFLVDGRVGLTVADQLIAHQLLRRHKSTLVAVNKIEDLESAVAIADFYRLGLGNVLYPIAAAHGQGVSELVEQVLQVLGRPVLTLQTKEDKLSLPPFKREQQHVKPITTVPEPIEQLTSEDVIQCASKPLQPIKIAIVGRPNVGKSMLTNRLLGSERVVVFDLPGSTRDSVIIPLQRDGAQYEIIDTAGVRRRGKVNEKIEKFSVIKTLQAIEQANVALLVIDAQQNITDQDLSLLSFIIESGRALVIIVNKWDGLDHHRKTEIKRTLDRRLGFINFARIHFISALHGSGVGTLFTSIQEAYDSAMRRISTPLLTRITLKAQQEHLPPLVHGRRVKLKYAHIGGYNPPTIVIHGNQVNDLPEAYRRYLINYYRHALKIVGTPIYLQFQEGANPYAHQRNTLTPSQLRRRHRLIQYHKRREKK